MNTLRQCKISTSASTATKKSLQFFQTTFYKAGYSLCQGLNLSPLLFSSSHSPVIMMAAFIAPETSILHNKAIDLLTIYKSLPFCNVALNKYRGPITTKRNLTDLLSLMSSVDLIFVQAVSRQFTQLKSFFFLTVCNFQNTLGRLNILNWHFHCNFHFLKNITTPKY